MPSTLPTPDPPDDIRSGCLYVVATPIGNREDITLRALKTLRQVDLIAAEDTRHTGRLLTFYGIDTPLTAYHEHNEAVLTPQLVEKMRLKTRIALVTDAGTPSVSDPGYRLAAACVAAGIPVIPVPGVSAATAALSVAGLPTDAFVFVGFLPRKTGKRRERLQTLAQAPHTLIFYESPHRIANLITEIMAAMGDRRAVLGREMTKLHEEFLRGQLSQIHRELCKKASVKGECTLLVAGCPSVEQVTDPDLQVELQHELNLPDATPTSVVKQVSRRLGVPRNRVYKAVLELKRNVSQDRDE